MYKKRNENDVTRYREKMRRGIIIFLAEEGPSPISEIAAAMDRDQRVIRNYLRHFSEDFEVTGSGIEARWKTLRKLTRRGSKGVIEIE